MTVTATVLAQGEAPISIEDAQDAVQELSTELQILSLSEEFTSSARKQASQYRRVARDCIDRLEAQIATLKGDIETLGPASGEGADPVNAARAKLEEQRAKQEEELAGCKLLLVNSDALLAELDQLQERALAERLTARSLNVFTLLIGGDARVDWLAALTGLEFRNSGLAYLDAWHLSLFIAITAGLAAVGLYGQRRLRTRLAARSPSEDMSGEAAVAFASSVARYMPALFVSLGWSGFWLLVASDVRPWPQLAVASFAISIYVLVILFSRCLFSPPRPARHYLPIDAARSKRFWHSLRLLVAITAVCIAIFQGPFIGGISEPLLVLLRAALAPLFIFSLIWTVWLALSLQSERRIGLFRPIVTLVLIGGLIAEWIGYHNLADYIVGGIAFSLLGLGLAWLITSLLTDVFDGIDEGRYPWQQQLRARFGLASGEHMPGLVWLRVLTTVALWGGLLMFLLRVWGLSAQGQDALARYLLEGFEVGPVNVVPSQLLMALALFAVLLSVAAWFKKQLDERWLRKTRLEHGARDATVTISGYVGAALAGFIALTVAGVDFKNLAIIAGALSVGIGFGLQNIVNNFVSGLILLFERPIRVGDWVVVGTTQTQGVVKRISIRSTQILTFDLADVIVPNSQLIADQVTNWMLRDVRGRVCIPLAVAYGSDTALVKKTLLDVAAAHPAPIKDGSLPPPIVLFLRFGATALEFELRFFIRNVQDRSIITSDINLAIDVAFRKAGIQLPYSLHDMRTDSWLGAAPPHNPPANPKRDAPPADET
ncbi:MAG: mechanosensitive ion channel domain-containing protein [Gammaproteobacteria bacterium]